MQKSNVLLTGILSIAGIPALIKFLSSSSELQNAVLFGLSFTRLCIALMILLAIIGFVVLSIAILTQPTWWKKTSQKITMAFASERSIFILILLLFTCFISLAAIILLAISAASNEFTLLKTFFNDLGFPVFWIMTAILAMVIILYLNTRNQVHWNKVFTPIRLAILFLILTGVYTAAIKIFMNLTWDTRMRNLEDFIFLPAAVFIVWGLLRCYYADRNWYPAASRILMLVSIGIVSYVVYRHFAQWMDWRHTPNKAYWPELADAFIHGRLYLINPSTQHDLTFYKGNWYVPNPPLPALILIPLVALVGPANINMVLFSIFSGSINVVLVYLVLEKASQIGMIPTKRAGNLWITVLFALGTAHWWLATMGMMWFVSQLLTLTFAALAVICVLYRASPWWAGLCLGFSMLSRPNVFTLWPLLAGIAVYFFYQEDKRFNFTRFLKWSIQSAVPFILAGVLLLYYNFIRFGDPTDFGYVTINSAEWLMSAVQTYGIFNVHFLPINAHMMFVKHPYISFANHCFYYSPSREGVSILSMSPALIYIFRRFRINLWTIGAWISILFSAGLLLFYHNNGSSQLGYRYLMDFILPVLLILGIGVGEKTGWLFKVLVILSVLSYALGIIWWYAKWWC